MLDPERRELTRGAEPVAIGPQVFDLLLHLVRIANMSSARTNCWMACGTDELSLNRP